MTTGIGIPFSILAVAALNCLQKSMMARPRWPSAGPIGGEGLAAPAGTCNFREPVTFFAMLCSFSGAAVGGWQPPHLPRSIGPLDLLHLPEFQFDRRWPAENAHRDLDARARVVDLLDGAVEGRERAVRDPDLLADLEGDRRLRPIDALLDLMQDALGLGIRERERLVIGAQEAGHLRGVLDQVIGLVGKLHFHQHITGEELALGVDLAAAPDLHDLLLRHHDLVEQVLEMALFGLLPDRFSNLVLEIRVGLHDVPAFGHGHFRSPAHPPPTLSTRVTTIRMIWSANRKKTAATAVKTKTMAVVIAVSRRDGQVTFWPSALTSCKNLNGLTFMDFACIDSLAKRQYAPAARISFFDPTAKSVKSSRGLADPNSARAGALGVQIRSPCPPVKIPSRPTPDWRAMGVSNARVSAGYRGLAADLPLGTSKAISSSPSPAAPLRIPCGRPSRGALRSIA